LFKKYIYLTVQRSVVQHYICRITNKSKKKIGPEGPIYYFLFLSIVAQSSV
jgi:hypothetical protein